MQTTLLSLLVSFDAEDSPEEIEQQARELLASGAVELTGNLRGREQEVAQAM